MSSLDIEKKRLNEQIAQYEKKKEEWRLQNKQLETYFSLSLEDIRQNFDKQLRDLVEKHNIELQIMEDALQQKQQRIDE